MLEVKASTDVLANINFPSWILIQSPFVGSQNPVNFDDESKPSIHGRRYRGGLRKAAGDPRDSYGVGARGGTRVAGATTSATAFAAACKHAASEGYKECQHS